MYAIVIAVLFLGEARELDGLFFLGVAIVLAAVFGHGWLQARMVDRRASVCMIGLHIYLTAEAPSRAAPPDVTN